MVFNTFLEEPSMATLEQKIIDELKLALEYQEPTGDYAQWLMGISLPSVIERKNNQLEKHKGTVLLCTLLAEKY